MLSNLNIHVNIYLSTYLTSESILFKFMGASVFSSQYMLNYKQATNTTCCPFCPVYVYSNTTCGPCGPTKTTILFSQLTHMQ